MLTANSSGALAGTFSGDSAARFQGHTLPSSSNKAGTSGSRAGKVIRGQAGNRVASKRETHVMVHGALRSISEVSFFGSSEL